MRVEYKWRTVFYGKSKMYYLVPWQCDKITEKEFNWQKIEITKYVIIDGVEFSTPAKEFKSYKECLQWLNNELKIHGNSNVRELIYGEE